MTEERFCFVFLVLLDFLVCHFGIVLITHEWVYCSVFLLICFVYPNLVPVIFASQYNIFSFFYGLEDKIGILIYFLKTW